MEESQVMERKRLMQVAVAVAVEVEVVHPVHPVKVAHLQVLVEVVLKAVPKEVAVLRL